MGDNLRDNKMAKHREKYFKKNFWIGVINGTLFRGGSAFLDPSTVIPEFLSYLTNSSIIIGGASAIFRGGLLFTQVLTANFVETKKLKKPIYTLAAKIRILAVIIVVMTVYYFGNRSQNLALILFLLGYIMYTFSSGLGMLPFQDIVAKTIYDNRRGSFYGLRWSFGSIFALAVGYIVTYVLSRPEDFPFPGNFALLFLLGGIVITAALLLFIIGIKEPPQENIRKEIVSFNEYFRVAIKTLRRDKNFLNMFAVRLLAGAEALSMPFFIRYARTVLDMAPEVTGTYLTVKMIGGSLAALLWARISDRRGNKLLVQIICGMGVVIVGWALAVEFISKQIVTMFEFPEYKITLQLLYGGVFALIGAYLSGQLLAFNNLLLEIAPAEKRPTYIGFFNGTAGFELLLLPLIGGVIVDFVSYRIMFYCALLLQLLAVLWSFKLVEPRDLKK